MVAMGLEYLYLSCLSLFSLGMLLVIFQGWFYVVEFLGGCFLGCMVLVGFMFVVCLFLSHEFEAMEVSILVC